MKRLVINHLVIVAFTVLAMFTSCDNNDDEVKDEDKTVIVTGVSLVQTSLTLEVNEIETLLAGIFPKDATDKSVTWKSDNTDIATVVNGIVTAVSIGTATITVTTNDGEYTAICTIYKCHFGM